MGHYVQCVYFDEVEHFLQMSTGSVTMNMIFSECFCTYFPVASEWLEGCLDEPKSELKYCGRFLSIYKILLVVFSQNMMLKSTP